jgi:hypothetical protein
MLAALSQSEIAIESPLSIDNGLSFQADFSHGVKETVQVRFDRQSSALSPNLVKYFTPFANDSLQQSTGKLPMEGNTVSILGLDLLKRFTIVLDLQNRVMRILRPGDAVTESARKSRSLVCHVRDVSGIPMFELEGNLYKIGDSVAIPHLATSNGKIGTGERFSVFAASWPLSTDIRIPALLAIRGTNDRENRLPIFFAAWDSLEVSSTTCKMIWNESWPLCDRAISVEAGVPLRFAANCASPVLYFKDFWKPVKDLFDGPTELLDSEVEKIELLELNGCRLTDRLNDINYLRDLYTAILQSKGRRHFRARYDSEDFEFALNDPPSRAYSSE